MHLRRSIVAVLLFTILLVTCPVGDPFGAIAGAQQQIIIEGPVGPEPFMGPGFGPRGQPKTGTGRIAGRVLSSDTGAPLRRAQVRLTAPEIGARMALTDADGRYEFRELPAARFNVSVSKAGYVQVQYGQSRPFESGRPIELADKQVVDKADVSIPRGGVISGRLVDEFGDPVVDAMVSAMRQTWLNGRRRLVPTGRTGQTNDIGQFRMYGLPPGEYYVSATLRNVEPMMFDAMLVAGPGATGSQPTSGYAPTFFPGTTTPANAQRVTVTVGQEAQNTDFALTPARLSRIAGSVIGADGKPLEGAMVTAVPNRGGDIMFGMMGGNARTSKDGAFTLTGVAPGDYVLTVRTVRIMTADGGDTTMMVRMMGGADGGDAESASLPLTVAGEDLSNVVIVTSRGATATGRVTFEGAAAPGLAAIRVSSMPADVDGPTPAAGSAALKSDGSFELKGLSGRRLLRVVNLPTGWTLKSVRLNGDDITDAGVDFKPGQEASGVEIVATNRATTVTGGVTAGNGAAVKDYTVVVFSDDPERWNLPMTRWVSGARPDQDGRFRIRNMPPGSYYAAAVDYVEQGSWGDPELLERLKTRARRFTLAEGATETLDLRLADQP